MRCNSSTGLTSVRLNTERSGLGMVLGPLELSLMQVLWDDDRKQTNKELRLVLSRTGVELSVTTIGTTMRRLAEKGLVREAQENSLFVYEPVMSEEQLELCVVEHIIGKLIAEWPSQCEEIGLTLERSRTLHAA